MVDMILFCDLESTSGADGKPTQRRVIRTKPNVHYEAGDRTGRLPEVIDLDFSKFLQAFGGPQSGAPVPSQPATPQAPVQPSPAMAPTSTAPSAAAAAQTKSRAVATTR
jgi:hypothetical protein